MRYQQPPRRALRCDSSLVSIVASCYNAEKYLEAALASIYAQSYSHTEVIIVDDGSRDGSYRLLKKLQAVYGFTLLQQTNQGVSAALNHGLKYARGAYVCTPDLDDIMLPHSIAARVQYLKSHPRVGLVGGLAIYMDHAGEVIKRQQCDQIKRHDFHALLSNAAVIGAPVSLYRMSALQAAGFYDPQIRVQDLQITLRIAHQGFEVHELPVAFTRYRRHPHNLSRNYRAMLKADLQAIAPWQAHSGYQAGRAVLLHKALKYAVVQDKADAWRLFRNLPFKYMSRLTLRRFRRFLRVW